MSGASADAVSRVKAPDGDHPLTSLDRLVRQGQLAHHPINLRIGEGRRPKGKKMSGRNGNSTISRRTLLAGGAAIRMLPPREGVAQRSGHPRNGVLNLDTGPVA